MKSIQIRSFFWSVFSRIPTEYGEIPSANAGKYKPEKTPYLDTFDVVISQRKLTYYLHDKITEGFDSYLLIVMIEIDL